MRPEHARIVYVAKRISVVCYLFMLALIAGLYAVIPHPVWALPIGITCVFGARASLWCAQYRRHMESGA